MLFSNPCTQELWDVLVTVPHASQAVTDAFELVMLECFQAVARGFVDKFDLSLPKYAGGILSASVRTFPGTTVESFAATFKEKMTSRGVPYVSIVVLSQDRHSAGVGNMPAPKVESVYREKPEET